MLEGFKHSQAIALFKEVKCGEIIIQVGRRDLIRRLVYKYETVDKYNL